MESIKPVEAKENRKYKDSVFVDLFSKCSKAKENALSLYNALHQTQYTDSSIIKHFELEDVMYQNLKNDVSFLVKDTVIILTEHQSTINFNMPVRSLMYLAREYEKLIPAEDKYKKNLIKLPRPEFVTLYNGTKEYPKETILKLSDAFMEKGSIDNSVELLVKVININLEKNHPILKDCSVLEQYSQFVEITRQYAKDRDKLKKAIRECIRKGILAEYLTEKGYEVVNMLLAEYDYSTDIKVQREEAFEQGKLNTIIELYLDGILTLSEACQRTKIDEEKFLEVVRKHNKL